MKKQYLEIGKVVGTHGIKGMVRIQPWADDGSFLQRFENFYLDQSGHTKLVALQVQPHGMVVIAKFHGVDSVPEAEALRGKTLYIFREDAGLPEGRYFVEDLMGCSALDADTGVLYGTVSDFSRTGANDVWHIKQGENEYLFPAVSEMIVSVDIDAGKVLLRPIKGIFDDAD